MNRTCKTCDNNKRSVDLSCNHYKAKNNTPIREIKINCKLWTKKGVKK